jgi:hypothetical protein
MSSRTVAVTRTVGRSRWRRDSGAEPDVDELEVLYRRIGGQLGEPGRGEHGVDSGFDALVVEALPILL